MIYPSAQAWRDATHKRVLFFGMSGLGKTHLSNMLRESGDWFHYSIDYRIGTRYMGELIADNAKAHAMKVPFLRDLLLTDSNLYRLEHHLRQSRAGSRPISASRGDPDKGGFSHRRISPLAQEQFRTCRDRGASGYRAFHHPRRSALRLSAFCLRYRRVDLRMGRWERSRRSAAQRAFAPLPADPYRRLRGAYEGTHSPL